MKNIDIKNIFIAIETSEKNVFIYKTLTAHINKTVYGIINSFCMKAILIVCYLKITIS